MKGGKAEREETLNGNRDLPRLGRGMKIEKWRIER